MTGGPGRPRVCLACEVLHPPFDEGIRIYAANLARELAVVADVSLLSERDAVVAGHPVKGLLTDRWFLGRPLARHLRALDPEAILYVPWTSLTARTFFRIASLRRGAPRARVGVVALQPRRADRLSRWMARFGAPDRVLATGPGAAGQARALGLAVSRVGAGVELERFRPARPDERAALRRRAGIDPEAFVVLHVGHLKASRNVGALARLAGLPGVRGMLVASTSTRGEEPAAEALRRAGVIIMARHEERMERVYQLCDAYLFPVASSLDAMETPLSVLEAAACDLPIIATRFGSLPDLLEGAEGVAWAEDDEARESAVRSLMASTARTRGAGTRRAVEGRSWKTAAAEALAAVLAPAEIAAP